MPQAARHLGLPTATIRRWIRRGDVEVSGQKGPHGQIVLTAADVHEIARHELFESLGGVFREMNRLSVQERLALVGAMPTNLLPPSLASLV